MLTFGGRRQTTVMLDRPRMLGMSGAHSGLKQTTNATSCMFLGSHRSKGKTMQHFKTITATYVCMKRRKAL
jgi:hypothetical protein